MDHLLTIDSPRGPRSTSQCSCCRWFMTADVDRIREAHAAHVKFRTAHPGSRSER